MDIMGASRRPPPPAPPHRIHWVAVTHVYPAGLGVDDLTIAGNGGTWIAAVRNTDKVFRSRNNGASWVAHTLPVTGFWRASAYFNGLFILLPESLGSNFVTSADDGVTWTSQGPSVSTYTAIQSATAFVAPRGPSGNAYRTTDGTTWSSLPTFPATLYASWGPIVYGNGIFVSTDYGYQLAKSVDDGATWTSPAVPTNWKGGSGARDNIGDLLFVDPYFIAIPVGYSSYPNVAFYYSTDGASWTESSYVGFPAWGNFVNNNHATVAGVGMTVSGGNSVDNLFNFLYEGTDVSPASNASQIATDGTVFMAVSRWGTYLGTVI